ncbi:MAG: hypothetical protein E7K05_18395, partial [Serratia marcescens]|nr:hypothetical protein [Serratia marcescens]
QMPPLGQSLSVIRGTATLGVPLLPNAARRCGVFIFAVYFNACGFIFSPENRRLNDHKNK